MQNEIPNPQSNHNSITIICVNQAFSQNLQKTVKWIIPLKEYNDMDQNISKDEEVAAKVKKSDLDHSFKISNAEHIP